MNQEITLSIDNMDDHTTLSEAKEIIKRKNLIPVGNQYIVESDPTRHGARVGRWNFKEPNKPDVDSVLHLVYPPKLANMIKTEINKILKWLLEVSSH